MKKSIEKYKFSVLLSVYHKEKSTNLISSINSIYENTLKPDEVILICDGKLTSELDSAILKLQKKYNSLKVIRYDRNRGLGKSLADGILHCKNEIIARMDTDDICKTDRFEKQIPFFKDKNISIIGSNIEEYNEDMTEIIDFKTVPETDKEIKKYCKKRNPFNHMSVIFRKSEVLKVGNYESVPYFEDYYLWCKLLKLGKGYNIQDNLVMARTGNNMIKRRGGIKYIKHICNFEYKIYKIKYINLFTCLKNIVERIVISTIPMWCRKKLYKKILRKSV